MKILKILILSIAFFATKAAIAQPNSILINNNTTLSYTVTFNFSSPCPPTTMTPPGSSVTSGSYCPGATLVNVDITFTDNTCTPPVPVTLHIPYVSNPSNHKYTLCDGTLIDFNVHDNTMPQYILDIN